MDISTKCRDFHDNIHNQNNRVTYYHEGWWACHCCATARGGKSTEIDREIIAVHDINANREGFTSCSACPFLAPFFWSYIPHNLGVASKVTSLVLDTMFFFADCLLRLQAVFRVARKCHCKRRVYLLSGVHFLPPSFWFLNF